MEDAAKAWKAYMEVSSRASSDPELSREAAMRKSA